MHSEDFGFNYTSEAEWDSYDASLKGSKNPEQCWILSDRDVWYRNPSYTGPEQKHPEEEDYEDDADSVTDEEIAKIDAQYPHATEQERGMAADNAEKALKEGYAELTWLEVYAASLGSIVEDAN